MQEPLLFSLPHKSTTQSFFSSRSNACITDHEQPLVDVDAAHEDGHVLGAAVLDAGDDQGLVTLVNLDKKRSLKNRKIFK